MRRTGCSARASRAQCLQGSPAPCSWDTIGETLSQRWTQSSPRHAPTPTPTQGRGNTWAHRGKNGRKHVWDRGEPHLGVGDSLHVPTPAPDQNPGKRLPGRPGTHPRRPPGDVFGASAPAPSGAGPRLRCPPWPGESGPRQPLPAALHSARARSAPPRQLSPTHHPMDQKLKKFAFRGFARPSGNFVRGHRGGLGGSSHSLALFLFLSLFCLFFPPTLPSESCWALSHFYSSGVGRGPLQGCPDGPRPTPPPPPRLPHSCADKTEIVRRRGPPPTPRGPAGRPSASLPEQRR